MRAVIGIFVLVALILSGVVEAQSDCRTRIVVYLDISGSMDVRGSEPTSPYRQTLEALRGLQSGDASLGTQDTLIVYTFGNSVRSGRRATGAAIPALLTELESNPDSDNLSDLQEVIGHLATQTLPAGFDRQLFIIASDMVHEKTQAPLGGTDSEWVEGSLQEVEELLQAEGSTLGDLLNVGEARSRLILFVAPLTDLYGVLYPNYRTRIQRLIQESTNASDYPVGRGASPQELVRAVKSELVRPLSVSAFLNENATLDIELKNPNCAPLEVDVFRLACSGSDGFALDSEPFPFEVPAVASITRTVSTADLLERCGPLESPDFTIEAGNSVTGKIAVTRLTPRSEIAIAEAGSRTVTREALLYNNILRIFVELEGQALGVPPPATIEISSPGGTVLTKRTFAFPATLEKEKKPYLLYLPQVPNESIKTGEVGIKVFPEGGSSGMPIRIKVQRLTVAEKQQEILFVGAIIGILGAIAFFLYKPAEKSATFWAVGLSVLLPALTTGLSALISKTWANPGRPFSLVPLLQLALLCFAIAWIFYLVDRHYGRRKRDLAILSPNVDHRDIRLEELALQAKTFKADILYGRAKRFGRAGAFFIILMAFFVLWRGLDPSPVIETDETILVEKSGG